MVDELDLDFPNIEEKMPSAHTWRVYFRELDPDYGFVDKNATHLKDRLTSAGIQYQEGFFYIWLPNQVEESDLANSEFGPCSDREIKFLNAQPYFKIPVEAINAACTIIQKPSGEVTYNFRNVKPQDIRCSFVNKDHIDLSSFKTTVEYSDLSLALILIWINTLLDNYIADRLDNSLKPF